jgi:hypothetical protein
MQNEALGTYIHRLIQADNVQDLRKLVAENPELDLSRFPGVENGERGRTPLSASIMNNSLNIFDFLLELHVDLEERIPVSVGVFDTDSEAPLGTALSLALRLQNLNTLPYADKLGRHGALLYLEDVELIAQPLDSICRYLDVLTRRRQGNLHERLIMHVLHDTERTNRVQFCREILEKMMRAMSVSPRPHSADYVMRFFSDQPSIMIHVILFRLLNNENPQFLWNTDLNRFPANHTRQQVLQILQGHRARRASALAGASHPRSDAPLRMLSSDLLHRINTEATPSYLRYTAS